MGKKELAKRLISKIGNKTNLNESGVVYEANHNERLPESLTKALRDRTHSLGAHPIFPESDESHFEEKLISKRYSDVLKNYKRQFDTDSVNKDLLFGSMMPLVGESMQIEASHKKELEKLAEAMIREEYDMGEDVVDIVCELTPYITLDGTVKNPAPEKVDVEFESHEDIANANKEVYKRRFLNAMIQGAAKKTNQMFHLVSDKLSEMNPQLPTKYSKMMAAADYMYYEIDNMDDGVAGGRVEVVFPKKEGDKPLIHAQAVVLPVLIHELTKGVMELLSSHGLPKDDNIRKYVIGKADFLSAEPWDMRLGPGLWEQFTDCIDADDFHLKHHLYSEICALPVDEFNETMKEIMSGTKKGKTIVKKIMHEIKQDLIVDSYEEKMSGLGLDDDYDM